eukprot:403353624
MRLQYYVRFQAIGNAHEYSISNKQSINSVNDQFTLKTGYIFGWYLMEIFALAYASLVTVIIMFYLAYDYLKHQNIQNNRQNLRPQ